MFNFWIHYQVSIVGSAVSKLETIARYDATRLAPTRAEEIFENFDFGGNLEILTHFLEFWLKFAKYLPPHAFQPKTGKLIRKRCVIFK